VATSLGRRNPAFRIDARPGAEVSPYSSKSVCYRQDVVTRTDL